MNTWRSGEVLEVPMSKSLLDAYVAFRDTGASPVTPRLAATVMLVRSPRQVFMLRRAKSMSFVPDAVVFPGGGVDRRDSDARLPWAGPAPSEWAHRMNIDVEMARCVVTAAAREVFEECGVLLAGYESGAVVADVTAPIWSEERQRLSEHESSFAEVLMRHNLVLRADLLGLRSHWLTPEFEPSRYDTYFFTALAPIGQVPDDHTTEANGAGWVDPSWMLDQGACGSFRLVPPTSYNLMHLSYAPSLEQFVAGVPHADLIMLEPDMRGEGKAVLRCQLP